MARKHILLMAILAITALLLLSGCGKGKVVTTKSGAKQQASDDDEKVDETVSVEDITYEEDVFEPVDPDMLTCEETLQKADVDFRNAKKRLGAAETNLLKATNALDTAQDKQGAEAELQQAQAAFNKAFALRAEARDEARRMELVMEQITATIKCDEPAAGPAVG